MASGEQIGVDRELYVNDATLELVQRRIEGRVRRNFFVWVGGPLGGGGLAAVLLTIFVWIPGKIETILAESKAVETSLKTSVQKFLTTPKGEQFVQDRIGGSVQAYLCDPESGQELLHEQVKLMLPNHIEEQTAAYFATDDGRAVLNQEIGVALSVYFAQSSGAKALEDAVATTMHAEPIQQLIMQTINEAVQRLSARIQDHRNRLVADLALFASERVGKDSLRDLEDFLGDPRAKQLRDMPPPKKPLALTFRVRQGDIYAEYPIKQYINRLKEFFGDQFRYVLILDRDETCLAIVDPLRMRSVLSDGNLLMRLLNSHEDRLSSQDAIRLASELFGNLRAIQNEATIAEALRASVWSRPDDLTEEVPVVDGNRHLLGTTTRRQLISGILGDV